MNALVIGLGISGRGAVKWLLKNGYVVYGCDPNYTTYPSVKMIDSPSCVQPDLTIVSPGIDVSGFDFTGNVIGELELGLRTLKNRIVGVTGTNGKTSVVSLVTHVLNDIGIPARSLGNIGVSICEYACDPCDEEVLVVELSSFQIEHLYTCAFDIGLITNISPDHLDRYSSFEAYKATKLRLKNYIKPSGIFIDGSECYEIWMDRNLYARRIGLPITACSWRVCQELGVSKESFLNAIKSFGKLSHRMEFIDIINGVTCINNSKATNIASLVYSVNQIEAPVFLLLGGRSKGQCFNMLKKSVQWGKVKDVYAIGESAGDIKTSLEGVKSVCCCETLAQAFDLAMTQTGNGDVVMLSPGCASLDQFANYKERGDLFKRLVEERKKDDES